MPKASRQSAAQVVDYGPAEDRTEEAGDACYMPPGHVPAGAAGTEFVQFSPSGELRVAEAAMAANMQQMQGA